MCEILAPAGGMDSALAAINSGADAIYLGLSQFSARSAAENFDLQSFKELSCHAHALGVKVYVAMNTLVKDDELEKFLSTLIDVWNEGADAVILSDLFLGKYVHKYYPEIKLHLSTQAGICNVYGAEIAKKYGFSRVILARETPIEEIRLISGIIETEVFVQGALCTCFSGQCYMSAFAGGNSGNRGKCKQPCRKLYSIDRDGFDKPAYRLSLSDLSVGNSINELFSAGVKSFKIEGRMRRPEYVSAAVLYYKNILENNVNTDDLRALKRTYNRGNYTKGLAFGQDKTFISYAVQGHIGEFVGNVRVENGKYICLSSEKFVKGDSFKILRDGTEVGGAVFAANNKDGFVIDSKNKLKNGDKVFVTTDSSLNRRLLDFEKRIEITVSAQFIKGSKAEVDICGNKFFGDIELREAENRPLTEDDIRTCFSKVDKYPFKVNFGNLKTDGVFLAASEINALRRKSYKEYYEIISANGNKKIASKHVLPVIDSTSNTKVAAIVCESYCNNSDIVIFKPNEYEKFVEPREMKGAKYIYLPPFMTSEEIERIKSVVKKFDGIYCDGSWAIGLSEELNKPLFAGTGFNLSNCIDIFECNAEYLTISKELTYAEQSKLSTAKTFALSSGDIKLMDLIYCPFGKQCKNCDRRLKYTFTDENGRKFPVRRYVSGSCRFEVFNFSSLVGTSPTGVLVDCTLNGAAENCVKIALDIQNQKLYYKNYTRGHSVTPIL